MFVPIVNMGSKLDYTVSRTDTVVSSAQQRLMENQDKDRRGNILLLVLLIIVGGLVLHRLNEVVSRAPGPQIGEMAPAMILMSLEGEEVSLEALRGQVVLLDFWATWCPPCIAALPSLNRVHEKYHDRGFTVVGVNQEPGHEPALRAFVAGQDLQFPVVVDNAQVADRYGVYALPTSVLIDAQGRVRAVFRGIVSEQRLNRLIDSVIAEGYQPSI